MLYNNLTTNQFQWISIELRLHEEISDSAVTIKVIGTQEVMQCKYRMKQVAPASTADKPDISLTNALNDKPSHRQMLTFNKPN
jgi:glutaredoxin-related protein